MGQTSYVFNSPEPLKILVLPDAQMKEGVPMDFLTMIGRFIVKKQPDVIVCIGDFADMESLSTYDKGKKSFEGRRYKKDIQATRKAMGMLLKPLHDLQARQKQAKRKQYRPMMHMTLGNHEHRITRAIEDDPKLDGTISMEDLGYEEFGWTVHDFLQVITINGISFAHYFCTGMMGRPASSAKAQMNKAHGSCVSGHQQRLDVAMDHKADGSAITSIICGSMYEHAESYLGKQGNNHYRGALMLHHCIDGQFDYNALPLRYFREKYSG